MGFVNTPYTKETMARPAASAKSEEQRNRKRSFSRTMTAQKVAEILENKYDIVETFSAIYDEEISNIMKDGVSQVANNLLSGGKGTTTASMKNLMKPYTNEVQNLFRQFLDHEEMNGLIEGVPTAAAMGGKLRGRGKVSRGGKQRPSFVNTGIYRASFRAWADTK
jgi:hypothetical protein